MWVPSEGVRCAFESRKAGWCRLESMIAAWAPPRIKQVLVSPVHGTPYLNTSQVFESIPKPRKWLAAGRTAALQSRLVREGTILVMASATVGRTIVATRHHEGSIISHHFMRAIPHDSADAGWVYAFLRSDQGQAMMRSSQYASIIRHIEPNHLLSIPIPRISEREREHFGQMLSEIVRLRNAAADLMERAFRAYERAFLAKDAQDSDWGFEVSIADASAGRRRFEASFHTPVARSIVRRMRRQQPLAEVTTGVWWGNRFKRIPSASGQPYLSADDLFTTNPYEIEKIVVADGGRSDHLVVEPGWILMACSGQTYGLNGSAKIVTEYHRAFLLSHDIIRIIPDRSKIRTGYLLIALTHPTLGRPLVLREAYGSSIPHIEPLDLAKMPIARSTEEIENEVADLAEEAASALSRAEAQERKMVEDASHTVEAFLSAT